MVAAGYGWNRPVADNSTADGRARNRRVEVIIAEGQVREASVSSLVACAESQPEDESPRIRPVAAAEDGDDPSLHRHRDRVASDAVMCHRECDIAGLRRRFRARLGPAALLLVLACSRGADEPPGVTFAGSVGAIEPLLSSCTALAQTPAGRWCSAVRDRLEGCEHFLSICPETDSCTTLSALECVASGRLTPFGDVARDRWLYRRVASPGWTVEVEGTATEGDEQVLAIAIDDPERARWARWLPADSRAGEPLLSTNDALVHLRYRPAGGLGISSEIGEDSLADRLFSLRSDLFTAAVLSGSIELAIYLPEEGQRIPPAALALDFRVKQGAVVAMERFIDDLRQRYPLSRVDFELEGRSGACLANLRVLPDLAPCYVATDRALVVGWNPLSLRKALLAGNEAGATDRLVDLYFDRFPEADARLAEAHGKPRRTDTAYPWRRARVVGRRAARSVELEVHLEPEEAP